MGKYSYISCFVFLETFKIVLKKISELDIRTTVAMDKIEICLNFWQSSLKATSKMFEDIENKIYQMPSFQNYYTLFYRHGKEDEYVPKEVTVVAAIDIGTSYSGYAYSTVKAYQTDHLDITCNQSCSSGGKHLISSKTPSCILMTRDKELVSFGYDAEKDYEHIIAEGNADNYYFFDKFKMALHKSKVFIHHVFNVLDQEMQQLTNTV